MGCSPHALRNLPAVLCCPLMTAPLPPNEADRLAALREYQVLDTETEQAYDNVTALAAQICDVPVAMISLVDESRQWFKAKVGSNRRETPRNVAFCAHAILKPEPLFVRDALKDGRLPRIRWLSVTRT